MKPCLRLGSIWRCEARQMKVLMALWITASFWLRVPWLGMGSRILLARHLTILLPAQNSSHFPSPWWGIKQKPVQTTGRVRQGGWVLMFSRTLLLKWVSAVPWYPHCYNLYIPMISLSPSKMSRKVTVWGKVHTGADTGKLQRGQTQTAQTLNLRMPSKAKQVYDLVVLGGSSHWEIPDWFLFCWFLFVSYSDCFSRLVVPWWRLDPKHLLSPSHSGLGVSFWTIQELNNYWLLGMSHYLEYHV